jgi:hypothetical protein
MAKKLSVCGRAAMSLSSISLLRSGLLQACCPLVVLLLSSTGFAFPVDRASVRYLAPETGGSARPRFITEREISLFCRLESLTEEGVVSSESLERYQRVVTLRIIAEEMLSQLQIESGSEPPKLMDLATKAREALDGRAGGAASVNKALLAEGMTESELSRYLLVRARAMAYVDRNATPLFQPSEDALYSAWRSMQHPFKVGTYEETKKRFADYFVYERFRTLELDFVQSARGRLVLNYL